MEAFEKKKTKKKKHDCSTCRLVYRSLRRHMLWIEGAHHQRAKMFSQGGFQHPREGCEAWFLKTMKRGVEKTKNRQEICPIWNVLCYSECAHLRLGLQKLHRLIFFFIPFLPFKMIKQIWCKAWRGFFPVKCRKHCQVCLHLGVRREMMASNQNRPQQHFSDSSPQQ